MQWMMLQQDAPEDYVIATGLQYSVRDFLDAAAQEIGIELTWRGRGREEKAFDRRGECVVAIDPRYFRPAEADTLVGDARKARTKLGWRPTVTFREIVAEMVASDLQAAERDHIVHSNGYRVYNHFE
jgi:GDPmannose 4,6-dehydratase